MVGLGLLGQLTVQILKAAGCRVLGMDVVAERVALACRLGADASSTSPSEFRDLCLQQSGGRGVDAILITAQTSTSDPVNFAAEIARDRAVVVAVGAVGMDIQRKLFYEKELDFRMSRSYGPGRYDSAYEQKGIDYPIGYVRWTETRNMDAFLRLLADRKFDTEALVTHRFAIERAHCAYDLISGRTGQPFLGVLITYPQDSDEKRVVELVKKSVIPAGIAVKSLSIGLLGAGGRVPGEQALRAPDPDAAKQAAVCRLRPLQRRRGPGRDAPRAIREQRHRDRHGRGDGAGPHARHAAAKFGFRYCATDEESILNDAAIATVVIATRHHLHASQVIAALQAGKHVFCEKPLCLREEELLAIIRTYKNERLRTKPLLMIGFNRRFAPLAQRMKVFLRQVHEPLALHYRVNAGFIAADDWVNDSSQGGGRILGEVCHFVDFLSFLIGAPPVKVETRSLTNPGKYSADNVVISLHFPEGSQGTVTYVANGDSSYSKERVEVFGGGAVAALEDFRRLELVRHGRKQIFRSLLHQDKGHCAEWQAFAKAIRTSEEAPIPFDDIVATTLATLRAGESRSAEKCVIVDAAHFIASASPN